MKSRDDSRPIFSFIIRLLSLLILNNTYIQQLFSSPIDVETAGRATSMAASGLVTRELVNNGEPRKQGFFNTSGLPVAYDDILFVDGTFEIESLVGLLDGGKGVKSLKNLATKPTGKKEEPLWEGALIGKRPYLYPVPVALFFIYLFWGIVNEQFVQVATTVV